MSTLKLVIDLLLSRERLMPKNSLRRMGLIMSTKSGDELAETSSANSYLVRIRKLFLMLFSFENYF